MKLAEETNVERLRRIAVIQEKQVKHLLRVLGSKCAELEKLKGTSDELQAVLDGLETTVGSLDAVDAASGESTTGDADSESGEAKERKKRTEFGPTQQTELAHVTERFELDEPDCTCPSCGGRLDALDGQFETSQMIDVIEVSYRVVDVQRQQYRCCECQYTDTALGPERATQGGRYSLPFAVKVGIDKYLNHLPLERQVRVMAQHGLQVTSQTLWDQLWALVPLMKPTYDAIRTYITDQWVIGLDQTGWPDLRRKKNKRHQLWALTARDAAWYTIRDDKSAQTFVDLVGDFEGTIVCDDLSSHAAGAREGPGIELAGCWAHILRRFRDAEPDFPQAATMLAHIRELYDIDAKAESRAHRAELRKTESADVIQRMKTWMSTVRTISSTSLGSAIKHTLKCWTRLTRFVDDPDIWLDNNPTERAIRGPVVGRRNHHGSKSKRGTQVAAIFYTLLETAKLAGVNPAAYLHAVVHHARATKHGVLLPSDFTPKPDEA